MRDKDNKKGRWINLLLIPWWVMTPIKEGYLPTQWDYEECRKVVIVIDKHKYPILKSCLLPLGGNYGLESTINESHLLIPEARCLLEGSNWYSYTTDTSLSLLNIYREGHPVCTVEEYRQFVKDFNSNLP